MGRPRKKPKEVEENGMQGKEEAQGVVTAQEAAPQEPPKEEPKPEPKAERVLTTQEAAIAESKKLLNIKLEPGQCFYEAPDGFIMIGDASRGRAWYRAGNEGKGMWINPRR